MITEQKDKTPRELVHDLYQQQLIKRRADEGAAEPKDSLTGHFIAWAQEAEQKMSAVHSQISQETNR